jgi:NAD(P)-dependent dehydrogenase (short-subunit alcohol dehydrogenase family)
MNNPSGRARSRVALVTGAGSGIGLSCAHALIEDDWSVVFAGRDQAKLERAVGACSAPERAVAMACDIRDEASVAQLFERVSERFGRLDLLFNNAGMSASAALPDELSGAAWRNVVDTNMNGAFYCLARAFAQMRRQRPMGGRIINNGSISAHVPRPQSIAYTATKHAITGLTRAAALDGRSFDIAVGQLDIGNAVSEMSATMESGMLQPSGRVEPEPRMDTAEVARAFMTMVHMPLSANILFMTVMATKMPYVGRG